MLAADVLYEEESVGPLLELLPRLASKAIVCSPERTPFERFTAEAQLLWNVTRTADGVVDLLEIDLDPPRRGAAPQRLKGLFGTFS